MGLPPPWSDNNSGGSVEERLKDASPGGLVGEV